MYAQKIGLVLKQGPCLGHQRLRKLLDGWSHALFHNPVDDGSAGIVEKFE
jgi:hypothetical protein